MNLLNYTIAAKEAALAAGSEILKIYNSADFRVEMKGDNSPLTKADQAANDVILSYLQKTGFPVLSEEGKNIPYEERKDWDFFWMIDPLDGTKEFIKKNGEFTVNIALIHNGQAIMGVVYAPVLELMYWGNKIDGAWKQEGNGRIVKLEKPESTQVKTIVASRSHLSPETQIFIDQYPGVEVISMGSSLKFMLVAEGKAQLYPRFAPTLEWDTAAAQAIVEASNFKVVSYPDMLELVYNKTSLLNQNFLVL